MLSDPTFNAVALRELRAAGESCLTCRLRKRSTGGTGFHCSLNKPQFGRVCMDHMSIREEQWNLNGSPP